MHFKVSAAVQREQKGFDGCGRPKHLATRARQAALQQAQFKHGCPCLARSTCGGALSICLATGQQASFKMEDAGNNRVPLGALVEKLGPPLLFPCVVF